MVVLAEKGGTSVYNMPTNTMDAVSDDSPKEQTETLKCADTLKPVDRAIWMMR